MMKHLKFAIFGTGFWSRYQLAAWRELPDVECVALFNRTLSKARKLADEFEIPADHCYDDPRQLLERHAKDLDFIDIITDVGTHETFARMGFAYGLDVITQKPFSYDLASARRMLEVARRANRQLLVHENFRWQPVFRQVKRLLDEGRIGRPWRGRLTFNSGFPVFDNQPFLAELDQFILTDVGTHVLDVARFLFGEMVSLYAQNQRIHPSIRGEDATTLLLRTESGMSVSCELSYASHPEVESFPQTMLLVEGDAGTIEVAPDFRVRLTVRGVTRSWRVPPVYYPWADARYDCVHSAIVPCHENLVLGLRGEGRAETSGEDNYRTLQLVFAAYESDRTCSVLRPESIE